MLTAKRERFVQNLVKGMSQREAYKNSYNASNMKDETIDSKASILFKDEKVRARYEELIKATAKETIITAQERMEFLTRIILGEEAEALEEPKELKEEIKEKNKIINNLTNKEITSYYKQGITNIDISKISADIVNLINNEKSNIKDTSQTNLDYTMIEFYTLIAMSCLYGGIISMTSINSILPNMSSKGKRISVSPIKKSNLILSSVLASYIIQLIGVLFIFAFTYFILHVDYGNNIPLILVLIAVGSLCGLSLGIASATLINKDENSKTGIIIGMTMLFSFFAGMMGISMKYIIDKNIPIINKLNPASMITDGFYAMYRYNVLDRYWFNVISLLLFSSLMIIISSIVLRRKKYDSI